MNTKDIRLAIAEIIRAIKPHDEIEREHIVTTLAWIESGVPLFRVAKPDVPPQHLVAYFVLLDQVHARLLLVDHRRSGLWLPAGGHVEPDEHPVETVHRELREELGIEASFVWPEPLFLTVTRTVGSTAGHTDVSLWYVLHGDCTQTLAFDAGEFHGVRWFALDMIPCERSDPHMTRFTAKLASRMARDVPGASAGPARG